VKNSNNVGCAPSVPQKTAGTSQWTSAGRPSSCDGPVKPRLRLRGHSRGSADDWNSAYYGKEVLPPQILLEGKVHNKQADKLIKTIAGTGSAKAQ